LFNPFKACVLSGWISPVAFIAVVVRSSLRNGRVYTRDRKKRDEQEVHKPPEVVVDPTSLEIEVQYLPVLLLIHQHLLLHPTAPISAII
jgi:hypothetical protein